MSYIQYPTPTPEQFKACGSETEKYRHLTVPYLKGCGLDVASQGNGVVPWAWQLDLPEAEFAHYSSGATPATPIQLRGYAEDLSIIASGSLDWLYASHLLEDFLDWTPVLCEWVRVIRPGGHLVILVPDRHLWAEAIARGQPPNCSHRHESWPGELSTYAEKLGLEMLEDRLTAVTPEDYSILFVGRKK